MRLIIIFCVIGCFLPPGENSVSGTHREARKSHDCQAGHTVITDSSLLIPIAKLVLS